VRACSAGSPASVRSTKLTPLTTRPSLTSRHGMTRIFSTAVPLRGWPPPPPFPPPQAGEGQGGGRARESPASSAWGAPGKEAQRQFRVEAAVIEGAAADHAGDAVLLAGLQRSDVGNTGDAARGDDREPDLTRKPARRGGIDAN